jgi:hypothetical protein
MCKGVTEKRVREIVDSFGRMRGWDLAITHHPYTANWQLVYTLEKWSAGIAITHEQICDNRFDEIGRLLESLENAADRIIIGGDRS